MKTLEKLSSLFIVSAIILMFGLGAICNASSLLLIIGFFVSILLFLVGLLFKLISTPTSKMEITDYDDEEWDKIFKASCEELNL